MNAHDLESNTVIAAKLAVAVLCAFATVLLVRLRRPRTLTRPQFDGLLMALAALSRVGLYVAVYVIAGFGVTGDVKQHYLIEGEAALAGQVVYRDFSSSYSPLFPYLIGLVLLAWHSAKAIVLAAIVIELATLPVWLAVARRWLDEQVVRLAALLYVTSPIALLNIAHKGQNQVWVSALLAVSLWTLARRDVVSGAVQGFSLIAVKALSLLFAPVVWLFAGGQVRWAAAFLVLPVLTVAVCVPNDINLLAPLQFQAGHFTGGNLPYLSSIFGLDPTAPGLRTLYDSLTVLALATVFLVAWARGVRRRPAGAVHLLTLVLMTFFLASKKAYASYLVMCFFPLCLTIAAGAPGLPSILAFTVFGILGALEPSLHFRWMFSGDEKQFLFILFRESLPDGVQRWQAWVFLVWDLALVSCYAVYFIAAWRQLYRTGPPGGQDS